MSSKGRSFRFAAADLGFLGRESLHSLQPDQSGGRWAGDWAELARICPDSKWIVALLGERTIQISMCSCPWLEALKAAMFQV